MRYPERELIAILKEQRVDFTCSLPCEKVKGLLDIVAEKFFHVPLTREEEGVGICAGAALSGRRPALFVQSSGMGNMINALLSLTAFYRLPLAVFVSRRGVYKEKIEAQIPMGLRLPGILKGAGLPCSIIASRSDFQSIGGELAHVYRKEGVRAFLFSPAVWEGTKVGGTASSPETPHSLKRENARWLSGHVKRVRPRFTRFEVLKIIAPYLGSKAVVCNLGFPSKELFRVRHQPSNFYMLGSMGMATPIGLGIALTSDKQVVVIDGDGSLLMNPGTLATVAHCAPSNLTIIAIDNGAYGSTGNQPTFTCSGVDLELMAKGLGIWNTAKVSGRGEIEEVLRSPVRGPSFIHVLAVPGNEDVPGIPIHHLEIKKQVQDFLRPE